MSPVTVRPGRRDWLAFSDRFRDSPNRTTILPGLVKVPPIDQIKPALANQSLFSGVHGIRQLASFLGSISLDFVWMRLFPAPRKC